jgi:histone H3/H4
MNDKEFSKNSVIKIARKAGIKCLSDCAINKIKLNTEKRVKEISEKLAIFFASKNSKTMDKEDVSIFLESEGIKYTINGG